MSNSLDKIRNNNDSSECNIILRQKDGLMVRIEIYESYVNIELWKDASIRIQNIIIKRSHLRIRYNDRFIDNPNGIYIRYHGLIQGPYNSRSKIYLSGKKIRAIKT